MWLIKNSFEGVYRRCCSVDIMIEQPEKGSAAQTESKPAKKIAPIHLKIHVTATHKLSGQTNM